MCTETIVVYPCGCFEVTELNCCTRKVDRSIFRLMYTIFDEPYPSEINMQVTCAECEDPKQSQYAQGE